jgi:hypothetical protein
MVFIYIRIYFIFIHIWIKAITLHRERTGSLTNEAETSFCAKYFNLLCKNLLVLKKTLCLYVRPCSVRVIRAKKMNNFYINILI